MWDRPVHQPPPCHESSLPGCPSPSLLQVWMNISSLTPWLLDFHTIQFSVSSGCFFVFKLLLSFFCLCEKTQCVYLRLYLVRKSEITLLCLFSIPPQAACANSSPLNRGSTCTHFYLPQVLPLSWLFSTLLWPQKVVKIIIFFPRVSAVWFMDLSGAKMMKRFNLLGQFWLNCGDCRGHCGEKSFTASSEHSMKEGPDRIIMSAL